MANYTFPLTTSATDERGIDYLLFRTNAGRAAQTPPKQAWNKQQLLQDALDTAVTLAKKDYKEDLRNRVGAALDLAAGGVVTQAAVLLGVDENPYD